MFAAYSPVVSHYHTHFSFTIITHVGGSNGVDMGWDLWNIGYPSLTTATPLKSQKILFNKRALGWNLLPPKVYFLLLLFDWTKSWMCFSFEKQNFTLTTFFKITIKLTQWSTTLSPSHSYFSLGSFAVHFLRHNNWLKQIIQLLLIVPLVPKSSYYVQAFISLNNLFRHVTCVFTIVLEYHT